MVFLKPQHIKAIILALLLYVIGFCEANYIETIAGSFKDGYNGDGGLAFKKFCMFNSPVGMAADSKGNMYIVDRSNHAIRKIDHVTKIITTIAGTPSAYPSNGYSGDGGPANKAKLDNPSGMFIDKSDNIYIADANNRVIRRIDAKTNIITTVVGSGQYGSTGDNGPALAATLDYPAGVYLDSNDNIYIMEVNGHVVRKVDNSTNIITTFAGSGGSSADNVLATSASLGYPKSIHVDSYGNMLLMDENRIRKVDNVTQMITTLVGSTSGDYSWLGLGLGLGLGFTKVPIRLTEL